MLDWHMATQDLKFEFMAPVLRLETGLKQHYVPLPKEIAEALLEAGARRVIATLNGYAISRGIQGRKDGDRYLMLGRPILREMNADFGDMVIVSVEPDPAPDVIELGEEFQAALDQDPEALARFLSFTPSRQRGLAYYVNGGKRVETRVSRALEIARKLRTYTLYDDQDNS